MVEIKQDTNGELIKVEINELIKEAIEKGTSAFITINLDKFNVRDGFKFKLESIGEGKDAMFRIVENSQINNVKIITPFLNILSISTIICSYVTGIEKEELQKIAYYSLTLNNEEITEETILLKMLEQCVTAYTKPEFSIVEHDEIEYKRRVEQIELASLKDRIKEL